MSPRFAQWASNAESDLHIPCETIAQQACSFYNGNFSSSVWGNSPFSFDWKEKPPLSCSGYSNEREHTLWQSASSKPKIEPIALPKTYLSSNQNRTEIFTSEAQVEKQDGTSSPFTFGFPATTSVPLFPDNSSKNAKISPSLLQKNVPLRKPDTSEGKTNVGTCILLPKKRDESSASEKGTLLNDSSSSSFGLFASAYSLPTHSLAGNELNARDGQQPRHPIHGGFVSGPSADSNATQGEFSAQRPDSGPVLVPSQSTFDMDNEVGPFVFGSSSALSTDSGCSKQRGKCWLATGRKGTSSFTSSKCRKQNNFMKHQSIVTSIGKASQPDLNACNTESSISGSCCVNSTTRFCDASSSRFQKLHVNERCSSSGGDSVADSYKNQSILQGFGISISHERGPQMTLSAGENQTCKSQHATKTSQQQERLFSVRQSNMPQDHMFFGLATDKGMPCLANLDKKLEKRETGIKNVLDGRLHEVSVRTQNIFEKPKLTESDINSPGKPSAENQREKSAKGGKLVEENKQQKENLEPKFSFGNQKGPRPFVFGSCYPTCTLKNTVFPTEDVTKNENSLRVSKEAKAFKDLVSELGEKLKHMGKFDGILSDQETAVNGKHCSFAEKSLTKSSTDREPNREARNLPQDAASMHQKSDTVDCLVNKIYEGPAKTGTTENKVLNLRANAVNENMNGATFQHAVGVLHEQISKLGLSDDKRQEQAQSSTSETQHRDSNSNTSILQAIEELSKQIAQLNTSFKCKDEIEHSSCSVSEHAMFMQLVEELQERIEILCKVGATKCRTSRVEDGNNKIQEAFVFTSCSTTAQKNNESVPFQHPKVFASKSRCKRAERTPIPNVTSATDLSRNQVYCSTFFPINNTVTAELPSTTNPFGQSKTSLANPFVPRQPLMVNPISTGPKFKSPEGLSGNHVQSDWFHTTNPFATGQSRMATAFAPRTTIKDNPFAAREPCTAHPSHPFSARAPAISPIIPAPSVERKEFNFGNPSSDNCFDQVSCSGVFEFQGISCPVQRSVMLKKVYRKSNQASSRRSSLSNSRCHSPGSPMDFSPCVDKAIPSSKFSFSDSALQDSAQMSSVSKLENLESNNMEEICNATSNLTMGGIDEYDKKVSGFSDCGSDGVNPFVLRQPRKGKWKRAPRKGTSSVESLKRCGSKLQSVPEMTHEASCEHGKGPSGVLSPLADPKCIGSVEWAQKNPVGTMNTGFFINSVNKSPEKILIEDLNLPTNPVGFNKEKKPFSNFPSSSVASISVKKEQICEKWRLRGNQAYSKGDYDKAEDCYTRGASSIRTEDASEGCLRASMLCYSNRAATRIAVGRMREALADCNRAMLLDSSFIRVRLRAASCHLALGESKLAASLFSECLRLAKDDGSSDSKVLEEAKDGLRKSQGLDRLLDKASGLLQRKNQADSTAALQLVNEVLTFSPLSEATLDLKAQTLFVLRRYDEVMQLCQKTLSAAEDNHGAQSHVESRGKSGENLHLWRWRMVGKTLFQLGRLDESLNWLTKYEETTRGILPDKVAGYESMAPTVSLIQDLLQHKAAGNEAFQDGKHTEALEHYTAALSCKSKSRAYNAVCFCNRAAASQALGHIADAISDCSKAIVLDPSYAKAISRRATLYELIRDFGQSFDDLTRLITLLERQESSSKTRKAARTPTKVAQDLKQAQDRMKRVTAGIRKQCVVDYYLILGLDVYSSPSEVKKAYRKAALKHHPDKAGQFLVWGEHDDDSGLWKDVGNEVQKDAERLFKIIGEAYINLSDPSKRAQFDYENEIRKGSGTGGCCNTSDDSPVYNKPSRWRHERKGTWSGNSPRPQWWQNGPDAA